MISRHAGNQGSGFVPLLMETYTSCLIASCGAQLVTSSIYKNCSRLAALRCRLSGIFEGLAAPGRAFWQRTGGPLGLCPVVGKERRAAGTRQLGRMDVVRFSAIVGDQHAWGASTACFTPLNGINAASSVRVNLRFLHSMN